MEYMESKMQDKIEGGIRYVEHLEQVNAALVSALEAVLRECNRGTSGRLIIDANDEKSIIAALKLAKGE